MSPDTAATGWRPNLGAVPGPSGTRFRVWAPEVAVVELVLEGERTIPLEPGPEGYHEVVVPGVAAGARYRYRLDGARAVPRSRLAPPAGGRARTLARWSTRRASAGRTRGWSGLEPLERWCSTSSTSGTFTPEGTFEAARAPARRTSPSSGSPPSSSCRSPTSRAAGTGATTGWPSSRPRARYGTPDELRALRRRGAPARARRPPRRRLQPLRARTGTTWARSVATTSTDRHHTPWGAAVNFDGTASAPVRRLLPRERRSTGSPSTTSTGSGSTRPTPSWIDPSPDTSWRSSPPVGHAARAAPAGDRRGRAQPGDPGAGPARSGSASTPSGPTTSTTSSGAAWPATGDGYFADFEGTAQDVAETLRKGWFYTGQATRGPGRRGAPTRRAFRPSASCVCLQNHDQVGNRAFGDRLHHAIAPAAWRAGVGAAPPRAGDAAAVHGAGVGGVDAVPVLHRPRARAGRLVTEGRRREFAGFDAFRDPAARERIPDPQAASTFEASRLRWDEREQRGHAEVLRLHAALLRVRREELLPRRARLAVRAVGSDALALDAGDLAVVVRLRGGGEVELPPGLGQAPRILLSTEDGAFAPDPAPPVLTVRGAAAVATFRRPGALVLAPGSQAIEVGVARSTGPLRP